MNLSQNGINLIKSFEGLGLTAYKALPTEKYFTIGYGHYGSDVRENETITTSQAESLLQADLKLYVAAVNNALKVEVNQNQFDALVSFTYNIGVEGLKQSTLLDKINHNQFDSAADEFDLFIHSGGKVIQGLVIRRLKEKALFLKPVPVPTVTYKVKAGDTLGKIALNNQTTVTRLAKLNGIDNVDHIEVGQVIKIPR
jgi:GH24 family phage-related lysozyme (muramidase)